MIKRQTWHRQGTKDISCTRGRLFYICLFHRRNRNAMVITIFKGENQAQLIRFQVILTAVRYVYSEPNEREKSCRS